MEAQDLNIPSIKTASFPDFSQNRVEIEEIRPERADFDSRGKFAPGNCANPGGRPKTRHLTEAYKVILETEGADRYARVITDIATDETVKASDRIAAVQEITDRVEGKATQRVDMRGIVCMMPAEAIMTGLDDWAGDDE